MANRTCRWAIILAGVFGYLTMTIASAPVHADEEIDKAVAGNLWITSRVSRSDRDIGKPMAVSIALR